MITKEVTIVNKAGCLQSLVIDSEDQAKYEADFYISRDGFEVNGKSIIGVMTLAAEQGSKLSLRFEGEDEAALAEDIIRFFEDGFGAQMISEFRKSRETVFSSGSFSKLTSEISNKEKLTLSGVSGSLTAFIIASIFEHQYRNFSLYRTTMTGSSN
ncbi:MAG: HPr family phosphocarrier protein [Ignavibacteria bacterium]|nr:HPr family phosphocarrier protein [Ignavibacteria bacterium]